MTDQYYAIGYLEASGVRCDSVQPENFLTGYLDAKEKFDSARLDRGKSCSPGNEICGKTCRKAGTCKMNDKSKKVAAGAVGGAALAAGLAGGAAYAYKKSLPTKEGIERVEYKDRQGSKSSSSNSSLSSPAQESSKPTVQQQPEAKSRAEEIKKRLQNVKTGYGGYGYSKSKDKKNKPKDQHRVDNATNEINDFAQGYLDAIGIRLDGLTDSPYEALKGVVDAKQRFDRKLNCTPPNKPCGRICILSSSECDIEGQNKSIAKATLKGKAIGYDSTGAGLFSPAGVVGRYAGGKIAKRKRIEQLQKEALATTRKEKKALERERIVGGAESKGAAKGALIAGEPGAIVGGKLAKRSAIKKLQKQEEARSKTLAGKVEKAVDEGEETIKKVGSSIAKKLRRR